METQRAIKFPKPTGSYGVGTVAYHLIDTSRKDKFEEDLLHPHRELMVQIWYPAHAVYNTLPSTPYAPDAINYWKKKLDILNTANPQQLASLNQIFVYAKPNAFPDQTNAPYPVLIFSPGFGQMRTHNSALCENVSSYGYIVISIDHTSVSENVTFPDGHSITGKQQNLESKQKEQQLQDLFVDDVAFVINSLENLNNNSHFPIYKLLACDHIGIFGHSIGGSTALFATKKLYQIKAGINIDGGILGNVELLAAFDKPFMHIIAEQSIQWLHMLRNLPIEQLANYGFKSLEDKERIEKDILAMNQIHAQQSNEVYRVIIHGGGHMSFCDAIFFKDNDLLAPLFHLQFGIGTLSGQKIHELATVCIIAFFDKYLKNKTELDIQKMISVYSEMEIEVNPQQIFE